MQQDTLDEELRGLQSELQYWQGRSDSLKVLINSHYGYLGGPFFFNDYVAASAVTMGGRELVQKCSDCITENGGYVIEIDTDGLIFVPPQTVTTVGEEEAFVAMVGSLALPDGIKLAHDGRYKTMLSLKAKNYVLESYDGKIVKKGNSLKSRSSEAYGKEFLDRSIRELLQGNKQPIFADYACLLSRIVRRELDISDIARRERVTEATKNSPMKARLREITKKLRIGEHIFVYENEDGSLSPIEDYANDYNVLYYCKKLHAYVTRLSPLFTGEEFAQFVKPGKRWLDQYRKVVLE